MIRRLGPLWFYGFGLAFVVWLAVRLCLAANQASDRISVAVASLLPGAGVLFAMVAVQSLTRAITGALDPTAGRDGVFLQRNQRAITNTVEQLAVFAPALLALAAGAPHRGRDVVAIGIAFAAARLAFWSGYLADPMLRAPGMTATFVLNAGTLIAAAAVWLI
ncbi:MAG: MAPEG family protein [Acetobacteraceae bacterium]|nr:MAPEG family protein [Acetobacteraceae bacterium]